MSDQQSTSSHDAGHGADHDDHGVGHIVPVRVLVATGLALLVLTWTTVAVAGFDLGEGNIYVALGVAVVKATLVALFFMHLRWDRPFNGILFVGSVAFVALFLALAITDSSEYQKDLLEGDATAVVNKLAELE